LSRPEASKAIIGADRLLADLESYSGDDLTMAVLEGPDGHIYFMLLDESASQLVACFVAGDRNMPTV